MTQQDLFDLAEHDTKHPAPTRLVAVLCVSGQSNYRSDPYAMVYDKRRDAKTFKGGAPVVAHPPCRAWSAFTAHQAKPPEGEKELGPMCADWLRKEGGVLEHPAHSRLFKAANLPAPGERRGELATIEVHQSWWGYPMRKATWLCFAGISLAELVLPYRHHSSRAGIGDRRRQQLMSKNERAETTPALAAWLLAAARSTTIERKP